MQGKNYSDESPRSQESGSRPAQSLLRGGGKGLRTVLIVVVALGVLAALWWTISYYWTDYLWYQEMEQTDIFWTPFLARLVVGLVFGLVFFALFYASVWLAHRAAPKYQAVEEGPSGNVLEMIVRRGWSGKVILAASIIISLFVAISYGGRWERVLVFLNRAEFGYADPLFGKDASFFVYTMPFLSMLVDFFIAVAVLAAIFTLLVYLSDRAFTMDAKNRISFAPRVKGHLSVLVALLLLAKAAEFALGRWGLVYSSRGSVLGANYTDVQTVLPVLSVLAVVCLVGAVILLVNVFLKGYKLPIIGLGLPILVWIIGGLIIPAAVQQFRVQPDELARDGEYIARNIESTRWAFGIDDVATVNLPATADLTADDIVANAGTIDNVRIWEPRPAKDAYSQLQNIRLYYSFTDVDVDRYMLDGEYRQVLIGARELDKNNLDSPSWVNLHLVFTHGYGFTLSPVNEAAANGGPLLLVRDIPPVTSTDLPIGDNLGIYYGEATDDFVIVKTKTDEFDYPRGASEDTEGAGEAQGVYTNYSGEGGISVGSTWRKMAFATRLGSLSILTSGSLTDESHLMFRRNILERVQSLAPFLTLDYDPYIVVRDDGSMVYMWDAYASSSLFPYSQPWTGGSSASANYVPPGTNYIRNSVKVVIDAYDGDVTFYQVDPDDPITNTWGAIYEDLFTPGDQMPADLRAHMRYPENLYNIQADVFSTYHMTNTRVFYNREDAWEIPTELYQGEEIRTEPYYQLLTLPGEEEPEFALLLPFTPSDRDNMVSILMARQDGDNYGELVIVDLPRGRQIDGPSQVEAKISNNPEISQQITLWDQAGSSVIRGNLLVVPIEDSVVYFEPVYLQADQGGTIPELARVIVFYQDQIVMEPTVEDALAQIFGDASGEATTTTEVPPETTSTTTPTDSTTVTTAVEVPPDDLQSLINRAAQLYEDANLALRSGDWAEYGRLVDELGDVLDQLVAAQ